MKCHSEQVKSLQRLVIRPLAMQASYRLGRLHALCFMYPVIYVRVLDVTSIIMNYFKFVINDIIIIYISFIFIGLDIAIQTPHTQRLTPKHTRQTSTKTQITTNICMANECHNKPPYGQRMLCHVPDQTCNFQSNSRKPVL